MRVVSRVVPLSLLVVTLLPTALAGCRHSGTPAPQNATATPAAVVITGPCALPRVLAAPSGPAEGAWGPVEVAAAGSCFRMSTEGNPAAGVPTDAVFSFESAVQLTPLQVSDLLTVEPPVELEITESDAMAPRAGGLARSAGQLTYAYAVTAKQPLAPGTVYRFALYNVRGGDVVGTWAFETRRQLAVVQTLPADQSSDVPTNTGIELTFNYDDPSGVDRAWTIDPPVQGTFQAHGRTVAFVPEALAPDTLYTVRLAAGSVTVAGTGLALAEPFLMQFETGHEERSGAQPPTQPAFDFSRLLWESATGSAPVLSMYATESEPDLGTPVPVLVYRFDGIEQFADSLAEFAAIPDFAAETRAAYRVDAGALESVLTFDAQLRTLGDFGEAMFAFPAPLDPGFYLVAADVARGPVQAWLQVTDVATYAAVSDARLMVWVNDAGTGQPITGADVTYQRGATWETDGQGVIFVDTPADMVTPVTGSYGLSRARAHGQLWVTAPDGDSAVVPLDEALRGNRQPSFQDWSAGRRADYYWRYLYPDRQLYRLTDDLRFWGVARPRDGAAAVQAVTVELSGGSFTGLDYEEPVVAAATVPVGAAGTYSGTLHFEGASPGFYALTASAGADELSRTNVELRDFVTPAYRIEVTPAERAVFAGTPITLAVQASFFEGSPVPSLALQADGDTSQSLVTDQAGEATLSYTAPAVDTPYGFQWSQVAVRPALAEEGQMSGMASVVVVPGSVAVEAEGVVADGTGVISGTLYNVDLDRVNHGQTADPTDFRAGLAESRSVQADLVRLVYRQIEAGTTYDFVNKKTVTAYRYETDEVPAGSVGGESDAAGRFRIEFPAGKDETYRVTVRVADDVGREARVELYIGSTSVYDANAQLELVAQPEGPYSVGDHVAVQARLGAETPPSGDRYLFMTARNGLRDYSIETSPQFALTFADDDVPNIDLLAVRFTGATYQETPWPLALPLDADTRALDVKLATDRPRYAPGDEVTLDVQATDPSGTGVAATVLLSAVDAAIAQLQGGGTGSAFRNTLYQSAGSGVVRTYASHQVPLGIGGAEYGGGGGERGDFRDVVLFREVQTGADGRASVTFSVPDNLTSWAVTALALTDDLHAGTGLGEVPVGVPLFVDVTMNDEYLTRDRPVVRLRSFGEGLKPGDKVAYELESDMFAPPVRIEGTAFEGVDVPLPALEEGLHEIRARATSGEMLDALVRKVSVVPSRLVAAQSTSVALAEGATLPASTETGSVELVVTDANRGRYYDDLVRLTWAYGDRLDQTVGRYLAAGLLTRYFTTTQAVVAPVTPHVYQRDDGGAALVPYGSSDLTLGVRLAAVAPDALGRQGLVQYFTGVLDDPQGTPGRQAEALAGLGCLGQPVLAAVQTVLAGAELDVPTRLELGLAAARLGDQTTADQVYRELVDKWGQERGSQARLNVPGDRDAVLEASALAAWLGAVLGETAAPRFYEYVANETAVDAVNTLLEVGYLQAAMPLLGATQAKVAYTRFGSRHEETIAPGQALTLRLSPDEVKALALEVEQGSVEASTTHLVPLEPSQVVADPAVHVTRSYHVAPVPTAGAASGPAEAQAEPGSSPAGPATTDFNDGDLVQVDLDAALGQDAAAGCYQLTDLLPSGLVPITGASQGDLSYYEGVQDPDLVFPYQVVGQRVSYCAYRDSKQTAWHYLARVVSKGTYVAEPALIQSMQVPTSRALSESGTITIR